jgi:SAM-dependent methyltransferase
MARALTSTVCRFEHFETDWYARWASVFGFPVPPATRLHRKHWEFCAIAQALDERGMLGPGRNGLGFAAGREHLASAFAARRCNILATDLEEGGAEWTTQHANGRDDLFYPHIVQRDVFDRLVKFQFADMRDIKGIEPASYDFLWSSCSFEHLGSLEAGADFVVNAMGFLKPGGIAVHTTEYNVSSNNDTATNGTAVIYRQRDIEELDRRLRSGRCGMERIDFYAGAHAPDLAYDEPPYDSDDRPHLKLLLLGYVATSILLIVRRY